MAENEKPQQEKTERATPKRIEEARKKGQVPRSRELNMAVVMISGSLVCLALQPQLGMSMAELVRSGLSFDPRLLSDPDSMAIALGTAGLQALAVWLPLFGVVAGAAVLGGVSLGGINFSTSPLAPKLSKLNPLKGLKRVFGLKGLVEVGKALGKAGAIGGVAIAFLMFNAEEIFRLSNKPLAVTMADAGQLVTLTLVVCSASLILIALVDVPFQLWNHQKELRMTRKEVQDEQKDTEGRPEVRSRVRQLQQERANQRMLQDVPQADVIITNPTHFAVALKYADGDMRAPRVLAKGVDHMAAQIRGIGSENGIALFEAPPLARALYWTTEVGYEIPQQLYLAVAQVLTYVYRLKAAAENRGEWPDRPIVSVDEKLTVNPRLRSRGDSRNSRL